MFKKVAILLAVLSIIGFSAYAFNTALLKGDFGAIGEAKLKVSKLGAQTLEIDWNSGSTIDLGEFELTGMVDMTVSDFEVYINVPETYPLSNYFSDITITRGYLPVTYAVEFSTSDIKGGYTYGFSIAGIPIPGVDFSSLEGSQVSIIINQFTTTDGTPYLLASNPEIFYFDNNSQTTSGYTYGGYNLVSKANASEEAVVDEVVVDEEVVADEVPADEVVVDEVPADEEVTDEESASTGVIKIAITETNSGTDLTEKLSTSDVHIYSTSDSSTEVSATIGMKTVDGKSHFGITAQTGEYNVVLSPDGYVSQTYGPYTDAENFFLAEMNSVTMEYGYYVYIDNDQNESTITANNDEVTCTSLGEGLYGCAIPVSTEIPSFKVTNGEFADYEADFTSARSTASNPSETAEMSLGDSSPITGSNWTIPLEITDDTGAYITGLTDSNFDLGERTLTTAEEAGEGKYYLYVEDPDSYDVNIVVDGYISNSYPYDSVSFDTIGSSNYNIVILTVEPEVTEEVVIEEVVIETSSATTSSISTDTSSASTTASETSSSNTTSGSSNSSSWIASDTSTSSSTKTPQSASKATILSDPEYVCTASLKDIINHWGYQGICRLYKAGIVSGKTNITFAPDENITRAEFLKIALGNAGYSEADSAGKSETMLDVNDSDWFAPWIKIAESKRFLGNGNVNWYPNLPIYRKDAVVIAVRIAKQTLYGFTQSDIKFTDVFVSDYFAYAVLIMNNTRVDDLDGTTRPIIGGYSDNTFRGNNHITRAEVTSMIIRAYLAWYN